MKKTHTIVVNPWNSEPIIQIMSLFGYEEINRVASGGQMSEPIIMITFQGENDINPNAYVEGETETWGTKFYNINFPTGEFAKNVDEFFEKVKKGKNIFSPVKFY